MKCAYLSFVDFEERFYNFGFPSVGNPTFHAAINGRSWLHPTVSAGSQSNELKSDYCTDKACNDENKVWLCNVLSSE